MNEQHHIKPPLTHQPLEPLTDTDLPIDDQGRIYHLQLAPEQIAPDILLVGDPGRAEFIGLNFFDEIEIEHQHRGLHTVTGISRINGEKATVISPLNATATTSGMGTPSLEIVLQELVALNEIDFETRTRKPTYPRMHIIRVGTTGGLQSSTALGTPIITSYAIGMDNTGFYYEVAHPDKQCLRLEKELDDLIKGSMPAKSRFYGKIHPYVARAQPAIVNALLEAADIRQVEAKLGLTVSSSGFFAPQGRDIARVKPSVSDLDRILAEYDPKLNGQRIENMEMESSFLLHFTSAAGYWGGSICVAIANRRENSFYHDYQTAVRKTTEVALLALSILRSRFPEVESN